MHLPKVITVAELTRSVARLLEREFPLVWVRGEVSNMLRAASGHLYFTLKDSQSAVRAVMFRNRVAMSELSLCNGMQIEVRALTSLYEVKGEFQITVEMVRQVGAGTLFEAFVRLRDQLATEGVFSPDRKRAIPRYSRCIGLLTSLQGAAIKDVISTLKRRAPHVSIRVFPSAVQGSEAVPQLLEGLQQASRWTELDVLLICRGGGSLEDLWSFNDERFVRALAACSVPTICGVGHETDLTLADLAADMRAPTPTSAAELACIAQVELLALIHFFERRLKTAMNTRLKAQAQRLDRLGKGVVSPIQWLDRQKKYVDQLKRRQASEMRACQSSAKYLFKPYVSRLRSLSVKIQEYQGDLKSQSLNLKQLFFEKKSKCLHRLELAKIKLEAMNALNILDRGFSIVTTSDGTIVRSASTLAVGMRLNLRFAKDQISVVVG